MNKRHIHFTDWEDSEIMEADSVSAAYKECHGYYTAYTAFLFPRCISGGQFSFADAY